VSLITPHSWLIISTEDDAVSMAAAITTVQEFARPSLARQIARIEQELRGSDISGCTAALSQLRIDSGVLVAAYSIKRLAGEINVVIHTLGILLSLPHILEEGEAVESLSLGAGNTGRKFDLETNRRIAEFKFITWRGGPESIRQNTLFKDFYLLAEEETEKRRCLYVVGTEKPLRFLTGGRDLASVMSKDLGLWRTFQGRYGDTLRRVRDYYQLRKSRVEIVDIAAVVPGFADATRLDGATVLEMEEP
jgi:hypothetical protein